MRRFRLGAAAVVAAIALLALPLVIQADELINNIDDTPIDSIIEEVELPVGDSATVGMSLLPVPGNLDGVDGCNPVNDGIDGLPYWVLVHNSDDNVASVTPGNFNVFDCDTTYNLTITALEVGETTVTFDLDNTKSHASGSFGWTLATFKVVVRERDTTPPVVTVDIQGTAGVNNWYRSNVTIDWTVSEPDTPQTLVIDDGCNDITVILGGVTAFCTATSEGGTTEHPTVTANIDKVKPVITGSASPPANGNGWNNTDVAVSFTCADSASGVWVDTLAGGTLTNEGAGQQVTNTGACEDQAGNVADPVTVTGINIDKTKPVITGNSTPAPNANGWNNTDVSVTFDCTDALSGIDTDTVGGDTTLTSDGAGQSVTSTGECVDLAGNSADVATVSPINIDKTPPTLNLSVPPTVDLDAQFNVLTAVDDPLSGVATVVCDEPDTSTPGEHVVACTATDNAGNSTSATASYIVEEDEAPNPGPGGTPPGGNPSDGNNDGPDGDDVQTGDNGEGGQDTQDSSEDGSLDCTGGILTGNAPPPGGGFGTFAFGGCSFAELLTASGCPSSTTVFYYNKPDGTFAVWIPGSQVAVVNAEILALFTGNEPIPPGTIFTARCV